MTKQPELSVIIPVGTRADSLAELHADYGSGLDACGLAYEIVYVLDGPKRNERAQLEALRDAGEPLRIVQLGN